MITSISFRGGEATGSVADRKTETAKQETTGGVGVRKDNESIFSSDNDLKQDTVCFRGSVNAYGEQNKEKSMAKTVLYSSAVAAFVMGLLGLAYKHNAVGKIGNEKVQEILRNTDVVTKQCYKACKWIKNNSYDKIVNFLK